MAVLDRWKLSFHGAKSKKDSQKDVVFNNYFGIGENDVCVAERQLLFQCIPECAVVPYFR